MNGIIENRGAPPTDAALPAASARPLTAEVAHEISNHLGCLILLPELILEQLSKDNPFRSDLVEMRRSALRISELAGHLSLLSIDEATCGPIGLNGPVRAALASDSVRSLLDDLTNVRLNLQLEELLPAVLGRPEWTSLMVENLVRHALGGLDGGGTVTVTTTSRTLWAPHAGWEPIPAGDYAVVSVADTGQALSADRRARLFDPYFAVNTLGRRTLSGLGLPVVRRLAKKQGLYIDVRSESSEVELYFPVLPADASDAGRLSQRTANRVLVVDDREDQRRLVMRILTGARYRVTALAGGAETLDFLSRESADLIILDISLRKNRDGLELSEQILARCPNQKILFVSGHSAEAYPDVLGRFGASMFLKKPFRIEDLLAIVRSTLPLAEAGDGASGGAETSA